MKIALIYTPRTGSTSLLKYFAKLKPNYVCYNEPWFSWAKKNVHTENTEYNELIKNNNLFIKSTLSTLPCSLDTIISDFHKVIFLLRKDFKSQLESAILVNKEMSYLNTTKRKYNIHNITENEVEQYGERINNNIQKIKTTSNEYNIPLFYYEDLYYGDFQPIFDELEIEYNQEYYDEYLNISNKYRIGNTDIKNHKTLI
jgi:hypothetical protein